VALQTQQALLAADQEHAIDASVRRVARRAAFHFYGRVLEDKGSTLLGVTLGAGFPAALSQCCAIGSAMRVVAISALHQAFRHAMMGRQRELCLDITVTAKTQLRLRLLKQTVVQPARLFGQFRHGKEIGLSDAQTYPLRIPRRLHQMRGVTVHTGNPVLHVGRMIKS